MLNAIAEVLTKPVEFAGLMVGIRHGVEEPPFTVIRKFDGVEIRRYCRRGG